MKIFAFVFCTLVCASSHAAVSKWVPFESKGGQIFIPVVLNGNETRAILDSGASGNAISERFLAKNKGKYSYGKEITVKGAYGKREVRLINGIDINMFGTSIKMERLMPVKIYKADLIVGLPFFESFILQIDYPGSRLRIMSADSVDLKNSANVKMKRSGKYKPMVRVKLNNEYDAWMMLDTGNSTGIHLPRKIAQRFDWLERYGSEQRVVAGVNQIAVNDAFNLPTLEIGPFTLENVIVMVPAEGYTSNVGEELSMTPSARVQKRTSDGILGFDVLKHFVVTIDFKRSLLHLAPPMKE